MAVDEEELRVAEDIVEHGPKSKLLKLRPIALAALCWTKLNIEVKATRSAVMEVLDKYVR